MVAHAGFVVRDALVLRRKIRVVCVGAVFTVPEERSKGLASHVLREVLAHARPGADLVMISGDRGLYRRLGMDPVPPLALFRLPDTVSATENLDIREISAVDLKAMAALYDAEDVHFIRPPDDWTRLWTAGRLVDGPAKFWLVERAGLVVAYLLVQHAGPRPDGSSRPRRILEFAGARDAIVQAAPAVAEELLLPAYDTATVALCEGKGWHRSTRQFSVTAEALTMDVTVIPWYGLNYV
ncbi:MAG: hypothetical protein H7X95_00910 [Deltaproteobacteria bacterium]|nr:hypothetical protein [Deltaproteobacteria bacterium]